MPESCNETPAPLQSQMIRSSVNSTLGAIAIQAEAASAVFRANCPTALRSGTDPQLQTSLPPSHWVARSGPPRWHADTCCVPELLIFRRNHAVLAPRARLNRDRASVLLTHAPDHPRLQRAGASHCSFPGILTSGSSTLELMARRIYRQFVYGLSRIGKMQVSLPAEQERGDRRFGWDRIPRL